MSNMNTIKNIIALFLYFFLIKMSFLFDLTNFTTLYIININDTIIGEKNNSIKGKTLNIK